MEQGKIVASLLLVAGALSLSRVSSGSPITESGEVRQPRNIYELVYSFDHTFKKILQGDDLRLYQTRSFRQIERANPELYTRISQDVKRWTDEWIQYARSSGVPIPESRLNNAKLTAEKVDATLRSYFEEKHWSYRPMRVEFLPPRLFIDERNRQMITYGMFIPYYPDAFFATIDWPIPMELLLVHESLHFNAADSFGHAMAEGITETAARYLVRKYDLLTSSAVGRSKAYPTERKAVEFVIERIME
ncbi:MAG TPA: hypothetical protein VGR67_04640 [Candidatus Polarisedimenticolia bacterium]|jgi:hypothetical protein|nr:hypothetical protein [Candidatus Polarisedimenticolia bacterium]